MCVYNNFTTNYHISYVVIFLGRRKIRSRLVNPTRASINGEDVFVLVTPTEIFQYIGAKANVLEKAKVRKTIS